MRGELDFKESFRRRMRLLKGMPETVLRPGRPPCLLRSGPPCFSRPLCLLQYGLRL
jgi:hypothetical protein